ncbi:DNA-binding transcriptional LysR family regulator [Luteibacter jiangsuensis]|uniref:DNA-binding transcriptional LysR family regulator n=1 Tax=Luteibacter jiangsuensis TaxID=637577 RepID=A0ABT9T266_9GAMM|nr:LysR family transcriptional regulator [Luteibacter jiangsuensis]MDQ0011360.1 DNA-binding transcriptional LysR family regulator [Luteibacter jiangsuensis]
MQSERFAEFLGIFVDVAREGSFSGAARRRGMQPSSVSRQIDMLESQLGTPLFLRSTRLLTLTDAGEALLVRARRILDELADAHQEIASIGGDIAGVFRLACYPTFGKRYVIPVMTALSARYPALRFELDLTERLADPVAERLDLVIRIGELADSTLIATRLATQKRVLCAHPSFFDARAVPTTPDELAQFCLIDKMHGADLLCWTEVLGHPVGHAGQRAGFACDDFEAMRLAALAGMGVAYLPDWVVGPDINDGTLIQVALEKMRPSMEVGIFALRALAKPSATVRLVLDHLKEAIGSPPMWSTDR